MPSPLPYIWGWLLSGLIETECGCYDAGRKFGCLKDFLDRLMEIGPTYRCHHEYEVLETYQGVKIPVARLMNVMWDAKRYAQELQVMLTACAILGKASKAVIPRIGIMLKNRHLEASWVRRHEIFSSPLGWLAGSLREPHDINSGRPRRRERWRVAAIRSPQIS
jgi:hypothetical protein